MPSGRSICAPLLCTLVERKDCPGPSSTPRSMAEADQDERSSKALLPSCGLFGGRRISKGRAVLPPPDQTAES